MECELKDQCSGCSEWDIPYEEQLKNKLEHFKSNLKNQNLQFSNENIKIHSIQNQGLRDRMDFIIEDQKMGLYSHHLKSILNIPHCPQLTPALQNFYNEFQKIHWPIKKGSFRLRVSPLEEKGAWLDFANEDVKHLFEEKKTLQELLKISYVEIGQRRKKLIWDEKENRFRLTEPEFKNWTNSIYNQNPIQLYSTIGSFSQVGHKANFLIQNTIQELCHTIRYDSFLEYGSGNGNLTFPALSNAKNAELIETDLLALEGLKKTLNENSLEETIKIHTKTPTDLNLSKFQMILANPPRSGLQELLKLLDSSRSQLPKYFIYMSCFPESFFKDLETLKKLGYQFTQAILIDQFPQTKHYEIISLLELA